MSVIGWDTEFAPFTEHCKAPPLACVSWARLDGTRGLYHWTEAKPHVAAWLEHETTIGHTLAADLVVVAALWPDLIPLIFRAYAEGRILDLRYAQKLADIHDGTHESPRYMVNGKPYTLEAMAHRHLKRTMCKDEWRMMYGFLRDYPLAEWPEGARKYPIDDAVATIDLWPHIQALGPKALGDLVRQSRHAFAFRLIECHGARTDTELVERIRVQTVADRDALASRLLGAGLLRVERGERVKCTKVAKALMLKAGATRLTKTGNELVKEGKPAPLEKYISTDAEACEDADAALAPHPDPAMREIGAALGAYAEYSHLITRLSAQIPHLARGELHSKYESLRETGRSASGKPYNMQNTPKGDEKGILLGERECFVPRPGYVFCDNDYGGLELATMSQMMIDMHGSSAMAPLLNADPPIDLHSDFGGFLAGKPYAEMIRRAGEPEIKNLRGVAKPCNFGLGGGMGPARLGATAKKEYGIVQPLDFWKMAHGKWRDRWDMHRHFAWATALTGGFKNPRPARVKQLRVDRWSGGLGFCDTANRPFQGLGADTAKDALFDVVRECYDFSLHSVLLGSRVVVFIHDQIITEVPISIAHEAAMRQTELMNRQGRIWCPDVPPKTVPSLCARMSKQVKTIYGPDGRLAVWEHPTILKARVAA